MPRNDGTTLSQPIFSEQDVAPDAVKFTTKHPSDSAVYKETGSLLKKEVVGFDASRLKPGDLYTLQHALGPHGPEIVHRIEKAGKIIIAWHGTSRKKLENCAWNLKHTNCRAIASVSSVAMKITQFTQRGHPCPLC